MDNKLKPVAEHIPESLWDKPTLRGPTNTPEENDAIKEVERQTNFRNEVRMHDFLKKSPNAEIALEEKASRDEVLIALIALKPKKAHGADGSINRG